MSAPMHTPRDWSAVKPELTAKCSPAHVQFLVADAKADIADLLTQRAELLKVLEAAYEHIMSEAEARNYDPPVPTELVADMTAAIARAKGGDA